MDRFDATVILEIADLNLDAIALNSAVLSGDIDGARAHARHMIIRSRKLGYEAISRAVADVQDRLGRPGGGVRLGLGAALIALASSMSPGNV